MFSKLVFSNRKITALVKSLKKISLLNFSKIDEILPKVKYFTKSGHTANKIKLIF